MPSFTSMLKYAAFGFAALASVQAAPVFENGLSLRDVEARCGCSSLPSIVVGLTANLDACLAPLKFATSANATLEIISPIVVEAKAHLTTAIADAKLLVGQSSTTILTGSAGLLAVVDIAALFCTLITVIFSACTTVISVVVATHKVAVYACLCELLTLVAELLQCCLGLVVGLKLVLLPLIFNVMIAVLVKLNICNVFGFLGSAFLSFHISI